MGGSSGGGGSGAVDFPAYMKSEHEGLLKDVKDAIHWSVTANPYGTMKQIDPTAIIEQLWKEIGTYRHDMAAMGDWQVNVDTAITAADKIFNKAKVIPDFDALEKADLDRLRARFKEDIIPEYRIGMRDAGTVMTSAYKIGEALMWLKMEREHAGTAKEAYNKYLMALSASYPEYVRSMLELPYQELELAKNALHYSVEVHRLIYAMASEVKAQNNEYTVMANTWPLEMRKYFFDALGCIQGAAGNAATAAKVSKTSTAIGGAISGAATGAMVTGGNPVGAVVGGAVGLIGGLFG